MTNRDLIKVALAVELYKEGKTLQDLENDFASGTKTAGEILDTLGKLVGGLGGVAKTTLENAPAMFTTSALLAGTTLGGLHYGANRSLDAEDKQLAARRAEVDRYKQLTSKVKDDFEL